MYVLRKSAEWIKSYTIFPKSIFPKSPNFAPPQFRTGGPFEKPKPFLEYYTKTQLKLSKRSQIKNTFFKSDRLSMDYSNFLTKNV
jgi:hypothetical protein